MVTYTEQHYNGDPARVYATGSSSGAMMTNALLALYPDIFKAGAAFMGVPFACFPNEAAYQPGGNSAPCLGKTAQEWGDLVRNANPGFSGPWPRMQLWHGTADTVVSYSELAEEIKQWTNVHGLSQTPTSTDTPQSGWSRQRFADSSGTVAVEAITVSGAGHSLPAAGMAAYAIAFFGLDTSAPTPTPTTPAPTTPAPTTPAPTTPAPTTPAPTTPAPTGVPATCTATYSLVSSWPGGFQAQVDVTSATGVEGWAVSMTLAGGQNITSLWNGVASSTSGAVSVQNAPYNGHITADGAAAFGFTATGDGSLAPSGVDCSSR